MDGYHYLLSVLWCLLLLKCDILYQHFACYIQCAFYCFQLLEWVQERVLGLGDSITTLLTLMAMGEVIFWVTWWHHETTTNDDEIKWTTLLSSVIIGGWCWSLAGDWWCINTGVMKALDRVGDAIDCAGLGWAGQGWAGLGWAGLGCRGMNYFLKKQSASMIYVLSLHKIRSIQFGKSGNSFYFYLFHTLNRTLLVILCHSIFYIIRFLAA